MKTRVKNLLAVMAVCAIGTTGARAALLSPGTSIPLSMQAEPAAGSTLIASLSAPVSALTFSGTLLSSVYANDSANPWGGLTFTYQLFNNGPDAIERLTLSSFAGFLADVSYSQAGVVPLNGVRTASGNQISFNFRNLEEQGTLVPGANSALLVIQTDSTVYQNSIAGVINSSTANTPTFAPAVVPEPATITVAVLGVAACWFGRRLKS